MTMTLERELEAPVLDPLFETFQELITNSTYPKPYESLGDDPLKESLLRQAAEACHTLTFVAAGATTRTLAKRNSAVLVANNYLKVKAGEKLEDGFEVWRNQFGYLDALYEQAQLINKNS